jgi:hypothetical protein
MLRNQDCGVIRRTVIAAAMFTVGAVLVSAVPAAAQEVQPFVDCVKLERRGKILQIAYFGYTNPGTEPVTLPAGTFQNYFSPVPFDRGQPSVFEPGEHHFVFTQLVPIIAQFVWSLEGRPGAWAGESHTCPSYLFYRGDWDPSVLYFDGDVVKFNGYYYQAAVLRPTVPPSQRPFVDFDYGATPEHSGIWQIISPSSVPVMNLDLPAAGSNVLLSTEVFTFPRNGRLTVTDARITADSVVQVEYVGGSILPGVAVDIAAGKFTAIGLPGKKFRYVLIN